MRNKTDVFSDFDGVKVCSYRVSASEHGGYSKIEEDLISIQSVGVANPWLTQEQAAEFAKQILEMCDPEYKI